MLLGVFQAGGINKFLSKKNINKDKKDFNGQHEAGFGYCDGLWVSRLAYFPLNTSNFILLYACLVELIVLHKTIYAIPSQN